MDYYTETIFRMSNVAMRENLDSAYDGIGHNGWIFGSMANRTHKNVNSSGRFKDNN